MILIYHAAVDIVYTPLSRHYAVYYAVAMFMLAPFDAMLLNDTERDARYELARCYR